MSNKTWAAAWLIGCGALCVSLTTARAEFRTIDGTANNPINSDLGSAHTLLLRICPPEYADGMASPSGESRPNPREISNQVVAQSSSIPSGANLSSWVFQWGQFLDHDLDLTDIMSPSEGMDMSIPMGDPVFDPMGSGNKTMQFQRSNYDPSTGTEVGNPREQINSITSYIDGSNVYGSDSVRADALRAHVGGRMLTSGDDLLPFNSMGLPNGTGGSPMASQFFVAGDVRANEQIGLTAVHTLFLREHNRVADQLAAAHPDWDDELLYQTARQYVGAEIQSITYNEFLPALMGSYAPSAIGSYSPLVDPSISTEFSTAFFRVGHTMLSPTLARIDDDGTSAPGGPLSLRDSFFVPNNIASGDELEYLLKGLASTRQQEVDVHVVDDVRNFLFGEPLSGQGFDLASLNIQRGRDHGLADYNTLREAYGLPRVTSFAEISSDSAIRAALESLYGSVDNIDPWIGALSEDHLDGTSLGPLIIAALSDQFTRSRDGDRFFFTNSGLFTAEQVDELLNTTLADVIRRNTDLVNLQSNVFRVPEPSMAVLAVWGLVGCGCAIRRAWRGRRARG